MLAMWPSAYPADTVLDLFTYAGARATYSLNLGAGVGLLLQPAFRVDGGATAVAGGGDGLAVLAVLHVAAGEDARHVRARPLGDDVSVLVQRPGVPGVQPAVAQCLGRLLGPLPPAGGSPSAVAIDLHIGCVHPSPSDLLRSQGSRAFDPRTTLLADPQDDRPPWRADRPTLGGHALPVSSSPRDEWSLIPVQLAL